VLVSGVEEDSPRRRTEFDHKHPITHALVLRKSHDARQIVFIKGVFLLSELSDGCAKNHGVTHFGEKTQNMVSRWSGVGQNVEEDCIER